MSFSVSEFPIVSPFSFRWTKSPAAPWQGVVPGRRRLPVVETGLEDADPVWGRGASDSRHFGGVSISPGSHIFGYDPWKSHVKKSEVSTDDVARYSPFFPWTHLPTSISRCQNLDSISHQTWSCLAVIFFEPIRMGWTSHGRTWVAGEIRREYDV